MKKQLLLLSIVPLIITGCNNQNEKKNGYKEETINVYYVKKENNTTCKIRYYNNGVIPYISIKDYQRLLYRGRNYPEGRDKFEIKQNDKEYTITVASGDTAIFDVKENKMTSSNLWNFKNTNLNGLDDKYMASYDGLPFVRVNKVEYDKDPKATTIDFSKYNLKIYGGDNDVYLPLTFATDLFANENILQGAYNTKDLYFFNYTENESLNSFGKDYYDPILSKPLKKDYLEYNYNEMCLDYDYFLGRPGRSSLETYYDLSNGLDAALNSRALGRTIIKYMKSTKKEEFLAGTTILGYLRFDGGHSDYSPLATYYNDAEGNYAVPSWLNENLATKATNLLLSEYAKGYEEFVNYDRMFYHHNDIYSARNAKLGKSNSAIYGSEAYTKLDNIAMIHIDSFMNEIYLLNEWDKYYNGERNDIPFGEGVGGAVSEIVYGVKEAAKDKDIEHLVIDLSANTGGSTDEMLFMIALLTGSKSFYVHNTLNDRYITATYDFDFNFDKKFDEKDEEVRELVKGKHISVLASRNGFSCGGISPIYLHEEGAFTIGEECGGGSCSIYMQYDAMGNLNRASSPSHTVTKSKVSIDVARKTMCDYKIDFPYDSTSQTYDYTSMFDENNLKTILDNHYNVK